MNKAEKILGIAIAVFSLFSLPSQGAIFLVTDSAGLQTALNTARTNGEDDTIKLLATTYTTPGSSFTYGTASNDNKSVTLSGGWNASFTTQDSDPYVTQLDGDDSNPVLQILANAADVNITFTIENLTILDGYTQSSDPCGAGIEAYTGGTGQGSIHLTVRDCLIKDNFAANNLSGGAIYSNGKLELYNTRFLSNHGFYGGALFISHDSDENSLASPIIIKNCYFEDNYNYGFAPQGSTIYTDCALKISGCTFKGRLDGSSSGTGSCIYGTGTASLNVTNSIFSGIREDYWGSAIQSFNGAMEITNCLFANNYCGLADDTSQGAVAYTHAYDTHILRTINITNCTFVGNESSGSYGAVSNRGATMNLNNCIFWDNGGETGIFNGCSGIRCGTTTMNYCDYYDDFGSDVTDGGGNMNEDPMFIGEGIYHLGHWSSCIDAGNNNLVPADSQDLNNDGNTTQPTPLDLGGLARFYDDPCTDDTGLGTAPIVDIGAFEFQPGYFSTFGTVNGQNIKLTLKDCDGNDVTFSLTGGGYGRIDPNDCSFSDIALYETTEKSVFTIATKGKNETSIGSIGVTGPLKAIMAKTTNVWGIIELDGSLGTVTLNDVSGDHPRLRIRPSTNPKATVTMVFDRVSGLQIDSDMPIKSITATEWVGSNGDIYAPWVGSLTIKGDTKRSIAGDLDIYLNLDGTGAPKGLTLGSVKVAGTITGGQWHISKNIGTIQMAASDQSFGISANDSNITALKAVGNKTLGIPALLSGDFSFYTAKSVSAGDFNDSSLLLFQTPPDSTGKIFALGSLAVKGQINNCQISSTGNIGTFTASKMVNATCFADVTATRDVAAADGVLDLPDPSTDIDERGIIKSIKISGIKGQTNCFVNSNIAAARIFSAFIAYPKYDNSDTPFGVSSMLIKSLTIKDSDGTHSGKNLDETPDFPPLPSGGMEIDIY